MNDDTATSDMTRGSATWTAWRQPRPIDGLMETPFHHRFVQVRLPGEPQPRTINPIDLPADTDLEQVQWRPMVWATEGAAYRRDIEKVSPECIVPGEGAFLFHRLQGAFEQVFEGIGLSYAGATNWADTLRQRLEWCEARGSTYRLLIVPETQAVYHDQVPGAPEPSENRPVMRLLRTASPPLREVIVYPAEALRAARARHETYQRDDIHFTEFGAYLCYRALMATLPQCAPERTLQESELIWRQMPGVGGFGHMLQRSHYVSPRASAPRVAKKALVKDGRFATGKVDVWETETPGLPTLVMFRTSNATAMFPMLLRHFSRIVAVATKSMLRDLIESERPDVVVTEFTERHLTEGALRINHDPDRASTGDGGRRFEEVTGMTLPLPRTERERA
jgi:hypothetical protein